MNEQPPVNVAFSDVPDRYTAPPVPPDDAPDPIDTEPVVPELDVPELKLSRPLTPALPAFDVRITIAPLVVAMHMASPRLAPHLRRDTHAVVHLQVPAVSGGRRP